MKDFPKKTTSYLFDFFLPILLGQNYSTKLPFFFLNKKKMMMKDEDLVFAAMIEYPSTYLPILKRNIK